MVTLGKGKWGKDREGLGRRIQLNISAAKGSGPWVGWWFLAINHLLQHHYFTFFPLHREKICRIDSKVTKGELDSGSCLFSCVFPGPMCSVQPNTNPH